MKDIGLNVYAKFETLSPFEIKDELIRLAKSNKSAYSYLNAGRGNPNWIATKAREAFFLLGFFALSEAQRVYNDEDAGLAGMPPESNCYKRLTAWLMKNDTPGVETLRNAVDFAIKKFDFDPDEFVHELTDSIIGDNYPVPDRALHHTEIVVHEYLMWAMCSGYRPEVKYDLFPVEGGTAAMCYIFKALKNARLLNSGDTIAIATPIFTPYLEMPELEDYNLKQIHVCIQQEEHYQFSDENLNVLEDKNVKALFLVNPGNPSAVALDPSSIKKLVQFVNTKRPDLIVLTDDVYGTFVPNFESLLGHLPRNTIGVYSYSKYFGCTGWRLGVIALAEDNIIDDMLEKQSLETKKVVEKRYTTLTLNPQDLKFIDRIVADSRDVALNHTAGLSLPQQIMMILFSLVELQDTEKTYQKACMAICDNRFHRLVDGLGIEVNPVKYYDRYYGIIDLEFWMRCYLGEDVVDWMKDNIHPLDISFKLARDFGIVLLNGSGFDAPNWSVRVSFANLDDKSYETIGRAVRAIAHGYLQAYRAVKGEPIQE